MAPPTKKVAAKKNGTQKIIERDKKKPVEKTN